MRRISDCMVYLHGTFERCDLLLDNGKIAQIQRVAGDASGAKYFVFPGFADVHVHLREPGFSYKETIQSGTAAAARGGYTTVCAMPNLSPVPDSRAHLEEQLARIRETARIRVIPYGAITVGQKGETLSDMAAMADDVAGFSDDGHGVQSEQMMRAAMQRAKALDKMIVAHCEDNALLNGGCVHDGAYAAAHGLAGISSMSEWRQLRRDLQLVRETGCRYHVCHISTKESVTLIRDAKREGLDVTCETAPHYLLLDDGDLQDDGRFKMNPPIRAREDREALVEGLADGTIDMIATDHAPHSAREKSGGLRGSLMGIVGLETAFPLLYTQLVCRGAISLQTLVACMSVRPAARFGIACGIEAGCPATLCIWDLEKSDRIDPEKFLSMGRATPFAGWTVRGVCRETILEGRTVYKEEGVQ